MSRSRCSRCGQEGHNRRNRNCPLSSNQMPEINQSATPPSTPPSRSQMTPELQARMSLLNHRMKTARKDLDILAHYIYCHNEVSGFEYAVGVIARAYSFCVKINLAIDIDDVETQLINHAHLFAYVSALINVFNGILRNSFGSECRLELSLQGRHFHSEMVYPKPIIRMTSAYLKEVSLIHDLTVDEDAPSCDCPLCFDSFAATNVLVTNCKHSFCITCVKGFVDAIKDKTVKPSCPMCRTDITEFKIGNQQIHAEINEHILNL